MSRCRRPRRAEQQPLTAERILRALRRPQVLVERAALSLVRLRFFVTFSDRRATNGMSAQQPATLARAKVAQTHNRRKPP